MDGRKYYWFKDMRPVDGQYRPLDATQYGLPGTVPVFCFFSSEDYAGEWLNSQESRAHSVLLRVEENPPAPAEWQLDRTDDVARLLAVCDEAAGVSSSPREAFFIAPPFDGFLVDPPMELSQAPLPMTLEQAKQELQS